MAEAVPSFNTAPVNSVLQKKADHFIIFNDHSIFRVIPAALQALSVPPVPSFVGSSVLSRYDR